MRGASGALAREDCAGGRGRVCAAMPCALPAPFVWGGRGLRGVGLRVGDSPGQSPRPVEVEGRQARALPLPARPVPGLQPPLFVCLVFVQRCSSSHCLCHRSSRSLSCAFEFACGRAGSAAPCTAPLNPSGRFFV